MKKLFMLSYVLLLSLVLVGCKEDKVIEVESEFPPVNETLYRVDVKTNVPSVVTNELEASFHFFWDLANTDEESGAYGLIPDRYNTESDVAGNVASVASSGFGLSALPIGVENGFITREEAEDRALKTLLTFRDDLDRTNGFYYHFLSMTTGERVWNSEVSIIDTALFINGALTAGRYFGGEIEAVAYEIYESVQWNWYFNFETNKFYMGYKPETGFEGSWNGYAEQLMIFILAAGSPDYSVHKGAYQLMVFNSDLMGATNDYGSFYPTYTGSLFTHQYSHAWFDFESYNDDTGFNWFTNSVNAVDAAIAYAEGKHSLYDGLSATSWGMSACDGPGDSILSGDVYRGNYGSGPAQGSNSFLVDGTVPAYGAVGSIVFRPDQAIAAMENYASYEDFMGKYGFKGAYNIDKFSQDWFAQDSIGIDKGISLLMLENYMSGMIWDIYMEVPYIQDAIKVLDFEAVE